MPSATYYAAATLSVLVLIQTVSALQCFEYTDCLDCVSNPNCGYCATTQICMNGTANGPTGGLFCYGGAYQYATCNQCDYSTCTECLDHAGACQWCENQAGGLSRCEAVNGTCSSGIALHDCPCSDYTRCYDCIGQSKCGWCDQGASCEEAASSTCQFSHNCNCENNLDCASCMSDDGCGWCESGSCVTLGSTQTCQLVHNIAGCTVVIGPHFDAGSFVGGMFLPIGLGAIALIVYCIWKKRQASTYTSVQ